MDFARLFINSLLAGVLILLAACVGSPPKTVTPGSAVATKPAINVKPMLAKAERALAQNRLLSPRANNAQYWFRQVLQVEPENAQALTGLQLIPLQYLQLARAAAGKGKVAKAKSLINRGLGVSPGHKQLTQLKRELQALAVSPAVVGHKQVLRISPSQLKQRAPELVRELAQWAQKARHDNLLAIIYSYSDRDSRWIYQQMRKSLPGYRLRADIRTGAPQLRLEVF